MGELKSMTENGFYDKLLKPPFEQKSARIGFGILLIGKRRIHGLCYVEEKYANLLPH